MAFEESIYREAFGLPPREEPQGEPQPVTAESETPAAESAPAIEQVEQPKLSALELELGDDAAIPEKFRNQPVKKVIESLTNLEREFTQRNQRNKELEYELELQRSAIEMLKAQAPQPSTAAPVDPFADIQDPDIILDTKKVLNRTVQVSAEQTAKIVEDRIAAFEAKSAAERQAERAMEASIRAAEAAREQLGFAKDSPEWFDVMADISPAIFNASIYPDGPFNPANYVKEVEGRRSRYGAPKPVVEIKPQGAPPGASGRVTPAPAITPQPQAIRLSERDQDKARAFANVLGIDPEAYVAKVAARAAQGAN